MRRLELFLIPVLLVTVSIASGEEPSAMKLQGRPKKVAGDWASQPTSDSPTISQTGGVMEGMPSAPMPQVMSGAAIHSTSMGQCGSSGCGVATCSSGACGSTCGSCGHGCCLERIKEWFCSRPLRACDKQVCYDPIPPLYQFFPACRTGYCPRLAPPTSCPQPVQLSHPVCQSCRTGCCKASCGSCASSCDNGSSCGSCSASCGRRPGPFARLFGSLRGLSWQGHCCTPSAQCFTNGQVTGGCANGDCGPK